MLIKIIRWICNLFNIKIEDEESETQVRIEVEYKKRKFMSTYELNFYKILLELGNDYNIVPQVNLGTVIEKVNKGYRNELFKNIDFGIFNKDFSELLLLIEINDSTHNQSNRKKRDNIVKDICKSAGIQLMTFRTDKPNENYYVINRIKNAISENNNTINIDNNYTKQE